MKNQGHATWTAMNYDRYATTTAIYRCRGYSKFHKGCKSYSSRCDKHPVLTQAVIHLQLHVDQRLFLSLLNSHLAAWLLTTSRPPDFVAELLLLAQSLSCINFRGEIDLDYQACIILSLSLQSRPEENKPERQ